MNYTAGRWQSMGGGGGKKTGCSLEGAAKTQKYILTEKNTQIVYVMYVKFES